MKAVFVYGSIANQSNNSSGTRQMLVSSNCVRPIFKVEKHPRQPSMNTFSGNMAMSSSSNSDNQVSGQDGRQGNATK